MTPTEQRLLAAGRALADAITRYAEARDVACAVAVDFRIADIRALEAELTEESRDAK